MHSGSKRRTLGAGNTGSGVALPIFRSIIEGAWSAGLPKVALDPPSTEAARALASVPIDANSGQRLSSASRGAFVEYLRRDEGGEIKEARLRLVGREDPFRRKPVAPPVEQDFFGQSFWPQSTVQQSTWGWGGFSSNSFKSRWSADDDRIRRGRRVDPDY